MNVFTKSMFSTIKESLAKDEGSNRSKFKEFLKTEPGNMYTVRLVPNLKDPAKTFFHYFSHSWESFSTGQFMSAVSPNTFSERDPISEAYLSIMKHGTEGDKKKARAIGRRENWLVNVYVINDPTRPENNGKVKILRYGKQLHKIVRDALTGDDSEDFGEKIFDLTGTGVNFKIKVERQGDFPTYVSSKFSLPSEVEGMTEDSMAEIHSNIHELDEVFTVKGYDDLKLMLDEHYYGKDGAASVQEPTVSVSTETPAESDSPPEDSADENVLNDDKVQELLKGLDG